MQKLPGYLEGAMGLLWVLTLSPRGGGHTPQNTPDFLAMVCDNTLFESEAAACLCWVYCLWALQLTVWMLRSMRTSMSSCNVYGGRIDIQLWNLGFQHIYMEQQSCALQVCKLLQ